jgi:hypothetical protein
MVNEAFKRQFLPGEPCRETRSCRASGERISDNHLKNNENHSWHDPCNISGGPSWGVWAQGE